MTSMELPDPGLSSLEGNLGSFPNVLISLNADLSKLKQNGGTSGSSETPLHKFTFGNLEKERTIVEPKTPNMVNGMLDISFSDSEVEKLAKPFELLLWLENSYGIPKISKVTKMLKD